MGAPTLLNKEGADCLSDWAVIFVFSGSEVSGGSDVAIKPCFSGFIAGSIVTQNSSQ